MDFEQCDVLAHCRNLILVLLMEAYRGAHNARCVCFIIAVEDGAVSIARRGGCDMDL